MKKTVKIILSVVLTLSMIIGIGTVSFAVEKPIDVIQAADLSQAAEALGANGIEQDEVYPSIIIHGIGQAKTYMLDENGSHAYDDEGDEFTGWPIHIVVKPIVITLLLPLLLSLGFQRDLGLMEASYKAVYDAMNHLAYNDDGTPKNKFEVESYGGRSIAECTQEEKDTIYDNVPLTDYASRAGEENLYYFAYDSFGDIYSIVDDLEALIEKVKKDTGKDKVNLVPISLGGAIAVGYIGEHPQGEDIHKLVFIVPAADGSEIVGKLMLGEVDLSDSGLYRDMFTKLVGTDDYMGWLINVAVRLLPKSMLKDFFKTVVKAFTDSALSRIPTMWGLVPNSMFDALAQIYLQEDTVLNAKIRKFHDAQTAFLDNLKTCSQNGVKIYDINGYGLELYSLVDSDCNSDKIIHSSSTSLGATFSKVNETLGDDYKQQKYTEYDLISPDRQVDASTCAFPFTTWFFANQDHEKLSYNDVVIRLATEILMAKDMNIYTTPDYPQFNGHRNSSDLADYLEAAKKIDVSSITTEQAHKLNAAIENGEKVLKATIIVDGECEKAEKQLYDVFIEIGIREADNSIKDKVLLVVFKTLSEVIYKFFGPRGFSDPYGV